MSTRFVHIRTPNNKGTTVGYRFNDAEQVIEYATSRVHKTKDQFNRRIGRAVTTGRLDSGRQVGTIPYTTFPDAKPTYRNIAEFFYGVFQDAPSCG